MDYKLPILRSIGPTDLFHEFFDDIAGALNPKPFKVDILDGDKEINVQAHLPGLNKDDIAVEYNSGVLKITAEKNKLDSDNYLREESIYGLMERSFTVGKINPESISASYKDGILHISLGKEGDEFKKIEIK